MSRFHCRMALICRIACSAGQSLPQDLAAACSKAPIGVTYENGCQERAGALRSGFVSSLKDEDQSPMRARWPRMKWDPGRAIKSLGLTESVPQGAMTLGR